MSGTHAPERVSTVVVGGGQAGLSVGYHLARRGLPFVILEANARVGDSWRQRWDSLRLFTPARYDGIDGLRFPARAFAFPTKDEMADYLEGYAERFELPVRTGVRVERVTREDGRFRVQAGDACYDADHVVVAMSSYQAPRVPAFASALAPGITQLHSSAYRSPSQLQPGGVLVVGAANSGAEIAYELARAGHRTWMSGRHPGHVPFDIAGLPARLGLVRVIFRVVFHRLLSVDTPLGRRVRPKVLAHGGPLIRVKPRQLAAAGIERVPRTVGTRDGLPLLQDDRTLDVANVVWCTGYEPGFSWLALPIFDERGEPAHERGLVADAPGLYFVGLHFLSALSSTMIHGVGRDAERIAAAIDERTRRATRAPTSERRAATAHAAPH